MQKRQEKGLKILRWLQEHINTCGLLVLLAFSIFLIPVYATGWFHRVALIVIYLLVVLNIPRYWRMAFWVCPGRFWVQTDCGDGETATAGVLADSISLLLFAYGIRGLVRAIVLEDQVKLDVILAAISGYLLLGLFVAVIVGVGVQNDPGAFDFQDSTPSQRDIRYFSFVTLRTLGYGDITPQAPVARSLAIFMALGGQVYMAVVNAMLVGKAGQKNGAKNPD